MPLRFDQPEYLWLLLLAVPVIWLGMRSLATLDRVRRWTAIALRVLVLTVLALMLAGAQAVRWHTDLSVVVVMDESESVRRFARPVALPGTPEASEASPPTEAPSIESWMRSWVAEASREHHLDDKLAWIGFDGRPTVRAMPGPIAPLDTGTIDVPREGSDTAAALALSVALFPADSGKRIVLITDGNDTGAGAGTEAGELLAAAREAKAAGVPIDVVPIEYHVKNEVLVEAIHSPTEAREGQTVSVRVVLGATDPTAGVLHVRHDGFPLDLNGDRPGTGTPIAAADWTAETQADSAGRWVCVRLIDAPMHSSGANRFEAVFEPADVHGKPTDSLAANNRAETFTYVQGRSRVLFVSNVAIESGEILPRALAARGVDTHVVSGWEVPGNLADLQRYDAVVFQNVPAEMVVPAQQRLLSRYVNDLGGGFIMIGGPDSFGAGGWTNSPIDRILPVECQIPSQTILPAGALVLVIDRSGSMSSGMSGTMASKQELANEAAVQAIATLYPDDMVGVIGFDHSPKWVVPLKHNGDPGSTISLIRRIDPQGGTDIHPALAEAVNALKPITADQAGIKHIILLTDGQSGGGDYLKIIRDMVQNGITLSTVGVGDDVNGQLLSQLAGMGGGNYHPISDPKKLPQVFIKEARSVRKNLIRESAFTPVLVSTGSPILAGIAAVPQLKGLVLTGPKRDPRVFTPIIGPEGEPVFAHWQVGLGRSAAFTSDATNRWATAWLNWDGYADFWTRTVRNIARPPASREFDMVTSVEGDTLRVKLDAASANSTAKNNANFANFLNVKGTIINPDGSSSNITLEQTGPGLYEAQTPAAAQGNYIINLIAQEPDGTRRSIFGGTSRPPGAELRKFSSNRAVLEEVARITGGRVLDPASPQTANLFTRDNIVPSRSIRPLWWPLLFVLIALFIIDVACRRIAWDVVAMAQWVRDRWRATTDRYKTREVRGEATFAALKARAADVDRRLGAANGAASSTPVAAGAAPARIDLTPDASKKFEANEPLRSVDELSEALGGATLDDTLATPRPAATRPVQEEQEATTSRLLDAKRRARERGEQ